MPRPSIRTACLTAALAAAGSAAAVADAQAVTMQMPFACGTTVLGQARADHNPPLSIDFNGPGGGDSDLGMPVVASAPGKVTISTYHTSNGYGNAIEIAHADGRRTFYAHLRDRQVSPGQQVRRGQLVGHVGKSSARYTFTAHLHYEQRRGGHVIRSRFDGAEAPVYRHMEQAVSMRSRNCGTDQPAPAQPAPAQPAPAPQGARGVKLPAIRSRRAATVQTDNGLAVSGRRGPSTSARRVVSLHGGDAVRIVCQRRGERVRGKFGVSRLWDLIDLGHGRGAYVTDTYVSTGSDGRVAPRCPR